MDRGEKEERIDDIYINEEAARYLKHKKEMKESNRTTTKPPEPTGSECVMKRGYRSVTVCLLLLCVLLLTAVIVLLINTNNHQSHITSRNITDERDQLLTKYKEERDQLLTKYNNITKERDQLLTNNTNLTKQKSQLIANNTNITKERDQLLLNNNNLTTENDRLLTNLNKQREQLNATMEILKRDGWTVFQSSLYFISSDKKTWSDSRTNCTQRGADLIIINNQEEQGFVKNMSGIEYWIGLSDSDVEGTWKWVDGSTLNTSFSFWDKSISPKEPNGGTAENCAAIYSPGWVDYSCTKTFNWICEKNLFK
nr:CD209 antigen-like [Misgurnus anguillicaudatus]